MCKRLSECNPIDKEHNYPQRKRAQNNTDLVYGEYNFSSYTSHVMMIILFLDCLDWIHIYLFNLCVSFAMHPLHQSPR